MDSSIPLDASLEGTASFNTALQQISEQQHGAAQFDAANMSAHCSVNRCLNNCSQTILITTWPQSYIEHVMYRIKISSNTNLLQGMTWFHVLPCFFYRYLLQRYISDLTSIMEHEEVENNRKCLSLSPSLSWHCTSWERTDWKSHMAGDKPRAGIVCTLCRGSGTLPPHLKGSSGLAECFWGCMSSTALFAYHRCYWSWSSLLVWTAVQSIQQRLSLSHQLGPVAASGEVKNVCSSLQWSVKAPPSSG